MDHPPPERRPRVEDFLSQWRAADRALSDARARLADIEQQASSFPHASAVRALSEAIAAEQAAVVAEEEARVRFQAARMQALERIDANDDVIPMIDAEPVEPYP